MKFREWSSSLLALAGLLLFNPVALGSAKKPRTVLAAWEELPALVEGRKIETVLLNGVSVRGRVIKVSSDGIEIDVRKSSAPALLPKGQTKIQRELLSRVKVVRKQGVWRGVLTVVMGTAGTVAAMLLISLELFGEGGAKDPKAKPFIAGVTAGSGFLGYLWGAHIDDRSFVVVVKREPADSAACND